MINNILLVRLRTSLRDHPCEKDNPRNTQNPRIEYLITDLTDSSEPKRGTRSPPDEHHHALLRSATHKAKMAVTTKKATFASSLKRGRKLLSLPLSATFTPYGM